VQSGDGDLIARLRRLRVMENLHASAHPSAGDRNRALAYVSGLMLFSGFGSPAFGLVALPIAFFLKNKLHLPAHDVANFQLVAAIPLYVGFLFGFARDRWDILGRKDRGMMMVFAGVCAAAYAVFAFVPVSYPMLLAAVVVAIVASSFAHAAESGLASMTAQQFAMTGRMSAIFNTIGSTPYLVACLMGGALSQALEGRSAAQAARILFLVAAAVMAGMAVYSAWKPSFLYGQLRAEPTAERPMQDLARLFRHWPVYPALTAWFLWSFAPGSATALQFHMQNTLHASDAQWGLWNAIFAAAMIPTYLLYGALCRRFTTRALLFWGAAVGIPQFVPLYFIHSANQALWAAAAIGLTGGLATAAYTDLVMRSTPRALQGTVMMAMSSCYWIAVRFGDVLGTRIYEQAGGFGACVVAITVVYACIIPVLLTVPRSLIATREGEVLRPDEADADLAAATPPTQPAR
jgi:MFS family permease